MMLATPSTIRPAFSAPISSGLSVYGTPGDDSLAGGAGKDSLYGGDGDDTLSGGGGADWLYGDYGNDDLQGGAGNDWLWGGYGDDLLRGGDGDDTLDGGWAGRDTASFAAARADMFVDLGQGIAIGEGRDRLYGIERIIGSAGDDTVIGDNGNNRLVGLDGDDALIGGGGHDTLVGGEGDDDLTGGNGDDALWGDGGDDTARFTGRLVEYAISAEGNGWLVRDTRAGGADGIDSLRGIETAAFADRVLYLDGTNNAPIAGDDASAFKNDAPARLIDVLANDRDFEGDALSVVGLDTSATRGQATLTADGHVRYLPGPAFASLGEGEEATDSLRYTVADGEGALTTATLTVRVMGPTRVALVSADASSQPDDGESSSPAVSADGRFVAFGSNAANLVAGDDSWSSDVFVKDTATGAIERISGPADGGIFGAGQPDLSADGRFVAFDNGVAIIVTDRSSGARTSIEIGPSLDGMGSSPSISDDGRYLVFASDNDHLVAGDTNQGRDIFLADVTTDRITRINTDAASHQAITEGHLYDSFYAEYYRFEEYWVGPNEWDWAYRDASYTVHDERITDTFFGGSDQPVISGNGRYVVFASDASNLVANDGNDSQEILYQDAHGWGDGWGLRSEYRTDFGRDIFRKDLLTGAIERVNTSDTGEEFYYADIGSPAISADGRYVAFTFNDDWGVHVKDMETGRLTRVSVGVGGEPANGASFDPHLSADGRYVSFTSQASNLVAGDDNGVADVFWKDLVTGTLTRVSRDARGGSANGASGEAAIAGDGHTVVFSSVASDIGPDHDATADVFRATLADDGTLLFA